MKLNAQNPKAIVISHLHLVGWHWLSDSRTLPIDGSVFITGKNGAGKSTVLDAFRLLFLLQTKWQKKGKKVRPVESFVRGTINESAADGPSCKRPDKATTHVAAELHDLAENRYIVIGVCAQMEPMDDRAEVKWWYAEDHRLANFPLLREENGKQLVLPLEDILAQPNGEAITVCRTATEAKKKWSVLFGLTDNYVGDDKAFAEWVKIETAGISIDGKENVGDIDRFIKDFVLQRNPEKIKQQQQETEAFRDHYSRFAETRKVLEARQAEAAVLDALRQLDEQYRQADREEAQLHIAAALAERDRLEADLHREEQARDEAARQTGRLEEQLAAASRDHDTYTQAILRLRDSDEVRALEGLRGRKQEVSAALDRAKAAAHELYKNVDSCVRPLANDMREVFGTPLVDAAFLTAFGAPEDASAALAPALRRLHSDLEQALPQLRDRQNQLTAARRDIEKEWKSVAASIRTLEKGTTSVDEAGRQAAQVQSAIAEQFRAESITDTPMLLCDLMDYRDESWAEAAEAYMGPYRYAVFVLPQNYLRAAQIYKELCRADRKLFGVTLVDTSALPMDGGTAPDTLPTVFDIENPYALAYVRYSYGNVTLVDDAAAISRQAGTFLSRDGMRYSRFSLQRMRPVQHKVIGKAARQQMLHEFRARQNELNTSLLDTKSAEARCQSILNRMDSSRYHAFRLHAEEQLLTGAQTAALRQELNAVTREITDFKGSTALQNMAELEEKQRLCRESRQSLENDMVAARAQTQRHEEEAARIMQAQTANDAVLADLAAQDATAYNGAVQFWQELQSGTRKGFRTLTQEFEQRISDIGRDKVRLNERMASRQRDFCGRAAADYDTNGAASMPVYLNIAQNYAVAILAKLQAQCSENEKTAYEYFERSVLSTPKKEYDAAAATLKKINGILKKLPFEDMVYSFAPPQPAPGYEDYFEMLFSAENEARTDQTSLLGNAFDEKYGDTRRRLFDELIAADSIENCPLLNYLTYCRFDMQYSSTVDPALRGSVGKRGADGSTSEADVPCYIALAAALVQKWNRDNRSSVDITNPHALKMMMVDEAFFSMDVQRTKAIIRFIQDSLGIQIFCAAPPDKYGSIGYLMDGVIRMTNNSVTHQRMMEYLPISEYEDLYDEDGDAKSI